MVTTPVLEPQDGDAAFFGKICAGVLVHQRPPPPPTPEQQQQTGHWITYVKFQGTWWCLDSVRNASFQQSPFAHQTPLQTIMQLWFKD